MNKQELISAMSKKSGLTRANSERAINAFQDSVIEAVASGEKVMLVGFGIFEPIERAARIGRNPKTNEEIKIPEKKLPKFKPGKEFRNALR